MKQIEMAQYEKKWAQKSDVDRDEFIICRECGKPLKSFGTHLSSKHNMTIEMYKEKYPNARTISDETSKKAQKSKRETKERKNWHKKTNEEKKKWAKKMKEYQEGSPGPNKFTKGGKERLSSARKSDVNKNRVKRKLKKMKEEKNRIPYLSDLASEVGHSQRVLIREFNGYSNLVKEVFGNLKCSKCGKVFSDIRQYRTHKIQKNRKHKNSINEKELIDDLKRVKKKEGKINCDIYDELGNFSLTTVERRFNGWNNALKKAGIEIKRERNISKEKLVSDFKKVKKKLGQVPTGEEYSKYGKYSIRPFIDKFDSWNNFLEKIGEEKKLRQNISSKKLKNDFKKVRKKLGRIPKRDEYLKFGRYSSSPFMNKFGSWNNFLREMGIEPRQKRNTSKEDFLEDLKRVYKEEDKLTGRIYTKRGKYYKEIYRKWFNSWDEVLKEVGIATYSERRKISKKKLLEDMKNVYKKYGKIGQKIYNEKGDHSYPTINKKFSWKEMKERAIKEVKNENKEKN